VPLLIRPCHESLFYHATALYAAMAWFQVNCPTCTAALQGWLDVGTTTVECSAPALGTSAICAALFDVNVPQSFLPAPTAADSERKLVDLKPRAETAYNAFMAAEVPKVKLTLPAFIAGRERQKAAFAKAAANWGHSSTNPKNVTTADGAAAGAVGGAAGDTLDIAGDAGEVSGAGPGEEGQAEEGEEAFQDALEHTAEDVGEGLNHVSDDDHDVGEANIVGATARQAKEPGRARCADPQGTPNKGGARKRR
jgi:hypothetical protein